MTHSGLQPKISFRCISYPVTRFPGGYWESKSPVDTAWGDLLLAILTPIGSRPMLRGFGSGLHSITFDHNVASLQPIIGDIIKTAAERWCPHVVLSGVSILQTKKQISIHITFSLTDDDTQYTRSFSPLGQGELGVKIG